MLAERLQGVASGKARGEIGRWGDEWGRKWCGGRGGEEKLAKQ